VNPSRWRDVNTLFHTLLDLPASERETRLSAVANDDPELAREVRSLIQAHDRSDPAYLESPAWTVAPELLVEDEAPLRGRIGTYEILEEIGRGGMGVVYAARDQRLGRTVALKALPAAFSSDATRRARLTREARAAAALSHPAIATIFALEEIDGRLFIVSELVRGRTLRDEIREGPAAAGRLLATLTDIAGALEAAHAAGIVHRDLKPENVVRRDDGQIKVLDFGLARWQPHPDARSMTQLTDAGIAVGTPGYMAPEQLAGGPADVRADIFSFGVMAWELATGLHPFGSDPTKLITQMTAVIEGRAPLPGQAPAGVDRVTRKCLRPSPSDRYPSGAALLADLRALESGAVPVAAEPAAPSRAMWWWQFHQISVTIADAAAPVLAFLARRSVGAPAGRAMFLAILGFATLAIMLRLNLVFTSRVHPTMLAVQRGRLFPWIGAAELLISALLLLAAFTLSTSADTIAAPLLSLALALVASLIVIEPATTTGAGLGRGATPGR